ncbi:MAG: nitrous oxide reductase accessory protein NosL, partial [Halobacteria archaeon]|nr:nitrous oxide reductase accessory protein NosL [Halobacteria archaeon]
MTQFKNLLAILTVVLVVSSLSLLINVGGANRSRPVEFSDTLTIGGTSSGLLELQERGYVLPRAEVFYSQYRYVTGYYGIKSMVNDIKSEDTRLVFGTPIQIYVSDFSNTSPELSEKGYINVTTEEKQEPGWVEASDAYFVVGSRAKSLIGDAVVPFSEREDAERFVR